MSSNIMPTIAVLAVASAIGLGCFAVAGNPTSTAPTAPVLAAEKSEPAKPAKPAGTPLAGSLANFMKHCPAEYAALTPQYQLAVATFVQWEIRDHGLDVVQQSVSDEYESGYFKLGERWCSIANSTARGIARSMTR
jgi:hypothetical protein